MYVCHYNNKTTNPNPSPTGKTVFGFIFLSFHEIPEVRVLYIVKRDFARPLFEIISYVEIILFLTQHVFYNLNNFFAFFDGKPYFSRKIQQIPFSRRSVS